MTVKLLLNTNRFAQDKANKINLKPGFNKFITTIIEKGKGLITVTQKL